MVGWKVALLGEVCGLQNGFAFKSKLFKMTGMPVLRISSIQDEQICDHRPVFAEPKDYKEDLSKYRVVDGDLLIAMSGATTGKVGFNRTGRTFLLNQRVGKFEPTSRLDIDYLFYFLNTKVEESLAISAGSAQPNLSTKQIKDFQIPLPPIPEQKRIVAILDEAFAGIDAAVANTEKNLANGRELFESYLNGVFTRKGDGWVEKTIADLCIIGDGNHSSKYPKKSEMIEAGIPFIRGTNLIDGTISAEDILFISEKKHQDLKKGHLQTNDILFTNRGEIGKVAIVDEAFNGANLNSQIAWLRCKTELLSEYLFFFLQSGIMKRHFSQTQSGAALQQFTIKMIKAVVISYPQKSKQEQIVDRLRVLSTEVIHLETIYQQKLAALAELKQTILQKAFAGELTSSEKALAKAVA